MSSLQSTRDPKGQDETGEERGEHMPGRGAGGTAFPRVLTRRWTGGPGVGFPRRTKPKCNSDASAAPTAVPGCASSRAGYGRSGLAVWPVSDGRGRGRVAEAGGHHMATP